MSTSAARKDFLEVLRKIQTLRQDLTAYHDSYDPENGMMPKEISIPKLGGFIRSVLLDLYEIGQVLYPDFELVDGFDEEFAEIPVWKETRPDENLGILSPPRDKFCRK